MTPRLNRKGKLLLAAIAIIVFGLYYMFGARGAVKLNKMRSDADSLSALKDSLTVENGRLEKRIEHLKQQNPETIESEARSLNMSKPDEELIIIHIDSSGYRQRREK